MAAQQASKRFSLVLVKPSHYDDNGYLIQWLRSAIPSNTLAVMNGLALECKERRVLGDGVDIEISAVDETNSRVKPHQIAKRLRGKRGHGRAGRRAIQPVSPRPGHGAHLSCPRHPGVPGRFSRFRLLVHAAGADPRTPSGPGSRRLALCRRSRRSFRRRSARRMARHSQAHLQLHGRSAVAGRSHACPYCRRHASSEPAAA